MLRLLVKNNDFVTVVVDPADYGRVPRCVSMTVQLLVPPAVALKVFKTTAAYEVLLPGIPSGVVEASKVNSQRLCW